MNIEITEDLREWDYGDYEGLTAREVSERRRAKGLDKDRKWDIWRDGCEGGECVNTERSLIAEPSGLT